MTVLTCIFVILMGANLGNMAAQEKVLPAPLQQMIKLTEGQSHVLRFEEDVLRIAVTGSSVDATPISTRHVLLTANRQGKTSLTIWVRASNGDSTGQPKFIDVDVYPAPGVEERLVDIEAKGVPLVDVLKRIAEQARLRLIIAGEINGKVSIVMKRVPVGKAMVAIARLNDLMFILVDDTLFASRVPIKELVQYPPPLSADLWQIAIVEMNREALSKLGVRWPSGADVDAPGKATPPLILFGKLDDKARFSSLLSQSKVRLLSMPRIAIATVDARQQKAESSPSVPGMVSIGFVRPIQLTGGIELAQYGIGVALTSQREMVNIAVSSAFPNPHVSVTFQGARMPGLISRSAQMPFIIGMRDAIVIRGLQLVWDPKDASFPIMMEVPLFRALVESEAYRKGETELIVIVQRMSPEELESARFADLKGTISDAKITVSFILSRDALVAVQIMDNQGKAIRNFAARTMSAGFNRLTLEVTKTEADRLMSSTYIVELKAGDERGMTRVKLSLNER